MSEGTVLLSPHSDDIVMQAFGMLEKNMLPGPLYLVTAFSRSDYMVINRRIFLQRQTLPKLVPRPNELIGALRKNMGHLGGSRVKMLARLLDLEEIYKVSRIRKSEDVSFAKTIGAKTRFFDLPDSKIRYGEAVYDPSRPLAPDEPFLATLRSRLERTIREARVGNVLSPWPYGDKQHVDHRLVCRAASQVADELNVNLLHVDDQPYSRRPLEVASDDFGRVYHPVLVKLSESEIKSKFDAMNIYGSQMIDQYFSAVRRGPPGNPTHGYSETLWTT